MEVCVPITEEDFEKSLSCDGGMSGEINLDGEIERAYQSILSLIQITLPDIV